MSSPVSAASTFFVDPELGADEVVVDVDLLEIDELVVDGPAEPRTPPWLGCRPKHAIIAPDDTKSGFTGYGGVLVLATLPHPERPMLPVQAQVQQQQRTRIVHDTYDVPSSLLS